MAHGNASDIMFLLLLIVSIQWWAFPGTLYADSTKKTADTDEIVKFGASLVFTIGCIFSTVKWNPGNGKGAGAAGFITVLYTVYSTITSVQTGLNDYLFYLYAAIILGGAVHIFVFPSNPLVKNTATPDGEKNNHGNFSDAIGISLMIFSLMCLFWPAHLSQDFGPIKALVGPQTPALSLLVKFVSCLMLMLALMFSGIKWDPINGKLSGVGCIIIAGSLVYNTLAVPNITWLWSLVLFMGAGHIMFFPSNPKPSNELKEDEPSAAEAGAAPLATS